MRKFAATRYAIHKRLIHKALTSLNAADGIWAGKQYLGQVDKAEVTGTGVQPFLDGGMQAIENMTRLLGKLRAKARAGVQDKETERNKVQLTEGE